MPEKVEIPIYKYKTQSLDEFACALALGAEIISVDRVTDSRFYTFEVSGTFDIESKMLALASKTLEVNAYALCDALRRAKSLIHRRPTL